MSNILKTFIVKWNKFNEKVQQFESNGTCGHSLED